MIGVSMRVTPNVIHPRASELESKISCVIKLTAAFDDFVAEDAASDNVSFTGALPDGLIDLERKADAMLTRATISIVAMILLREERRHRVSMGVVQLDPVEACFASARRGFRKYSRKHSRQLANVLRPQVGHALASAVAQIAELSRTQSFVELVIRTAQEPIA